MRLYVVVLLWLWDCGTVARYRVLRCSGPSIAAEFDVASAHTFQHVFADPHIWHMYLFPCADLSQRPMSSKRQPVGALAPIRSAPSYVVCTRIHLPLHMLPAPEYARPFICCLHPNAPAPSYVACIRIYLPLRSYPSDHVPSTTCHLTHALQTVPPISYVPISLVIRHTFAQHHTCAKARRVVHSAATWVYRHIGESLPIIILSEDPRLAADFGTETVGVLVLSIADYLQQFWPDGACCCIRAVMCLRCAYVRDCVFFHILAYVCVYACVRVFVFACSWVLVCMRVFLWVVVSSTFLFTRWFGYARLSI